MVSTLSDGRIVGWRVWRVAAGSLYSAWCADEWGPVMEAKCPGFSPGPAYCTRPPGLKCICGIYAFRDCRGEEFGDLLAVGLPFSTWGVYGLAVGPAYLWGRIIEHEHGYRAQYAQVGSPLVVTGPRDMDVSSMVRRYGVDVFAPFTSARTFPQRERLEETAVEILRGGEQGADRRAG